MMSKEEIIRRLRVLEAIPYGERPVSFRRIAKLAGMSGQHGQLRGNHKAAFDENMRASTQARLSQALTWIENNQVGVKRKSDLTIRAPAPRCEMRMRYRVTEKGFEVVKVAVNPLALPSVDFSRIRESNTAHGSHQRIPMPCSRSV